MIRSFPVFSFALGSLFAALGVFVIPVSFSVQGFGMLVSPDGVRTVRSADSGTVHHAEPSEDGWFAPGRIVTVIAPAAGGARNAFLLEKLRRDLLEASTKLGEDISKLRAELARQQASHLALGHRVSASTQQAARIMDHRKEVIAFRTKMRAEIESLSEARLSRLRALEDMLHRTGEHGVMPEQQRLEMIQKLYSDRSSTFSGISGGFSTDQQILNLNKELEQLEYALTIDRAEQSIAAARIGEIRTQLTELERLLGLMVQEAESSYLAGIAIPQVTLSIGRWRDLRVVQADRAEVTPNEVVRLIETADRAPGIYLTSIGEAAELSLMIGVPEAAELTLDMTSPDAVIRDSLASFGWRAGTVSRDQLRVGALNIQSIFIPLDADAAQADFVPPNVMKATARAASDLPLLADVYFVEGSTDKSAETRNILVGFVENRHALVLSPDQPVHLTLKDSRDSSSIVLTGRLGDTHLSTVDTTELALRLGNESLARKIIARSVLSQVSIILPPNEMRRTEGRRGAVIDLSFPLARQSLFSFLSSHSVTG